MLKKSPAQLFCDPIHSQGKGTHMPNCTCVEVKEKLYSTGPLLHYVSIVNQIQTVRLATCPLLPKEGL